MEQNRRGIGRYKGLLAIAICAILAWSAGVGLIFGLRTTRAAAPADFVPVIVAAGGSHSLAIDHYGYVWAWGANSNGQLGDGTTAEKRNPTCLGDDRQYIAIAAGTSHSLAIDIDGDLWAWGLQTNGRLGNGQTGATNISTPVQIGTRKYKAISAGDAHSLAISVDDELYAWGSQADGRLGNGQTGNGSVSTPTQIGGMKYKVISAGNAHSLAITEDDDLYAWGLQTNGRLGNGSTATSGLGTPTQIGTAKWKAVSAATTHTIAIDENDDLYAFGSQANGRLGDGTAATASVDTPKKIGNAKWKVISASNEYSHGIQLNGELYGWGRRNSGRLGNNTTDNDNNASQGQPTPTAVSTSKYTLVAGMNTHTLALGEDGFAYGWGTNSNGRIGDGSTSQRNVPVQISHTAPELCDGCHRYVVVCICPCDNCGSYPCVCCPDCGEPPWICTLCLGCGNHTCDQSTGDCICIGCGNPQSDCTCCDEGRHAYDDGDITELPTCSELGELTFTCTRCAYFYTENIALDPDAHSSGVWSTISAGTCTTPGLRELRCEDCDFLLDTEELLDPSNHAGDCVCICGDCGKPLADCDCACLADGHDFDNGQITRHPTCSVQGEKRITCIRCGETEIRAIAVDPNAHLPGAWTTVREGTCTTPGRREFRCTGCNQILDFEELLDLDNHGDDCECPCAVCGNFPCVCCEVCGEPPATCECCDDPCYDLDCMIHNAPPKPHIDMTGAKLEAKISEGKLEVSGIPDPDGRVTYEWFRRVSLAGEAAPSGNGASVDIALHPDHMVIYEVKVYIDGEFAFSFMKEFRATATQRSNSFGEVWMWLVGGIGIIIFGVLIFMYRDMTRDLYKDIKKSNKKPKKPKSFDGPDGDTQSQKQKWEAAHQKRMEEARKQRPERDGKKRDVGKIGDFL